jgi:hypothetical protein
MTDPPVATVDALGIDPVELPHPLGKIALRRLYHHVRVVGHLAVGMAAPIEPAADLPEELQPSAAVIVVEIDVLPSVAPRGDMIEPAG